MPKKIAIIITLGVIALLAVAGAGVYLAQQRQEGAEKVRQEGVATVPKAPEEPVVTKPIDTSDWKVYRNEQYGFEMKYPRDFSVLSSFKSQNYRPETCCVGLRLPYMKIDAVEAVAFYSGSFVPMVAFYVYENPKQLPIDSWLIETARTEEKMFSVIEEWRYVPPALEGLKVLYTKSITPPFVNKILFFSKGRLAYILILTEYIGMELETPPHFGEIIWSLRFLK